ncbi:MAG: 1-deoxy-D-xylulose-5-phosphate reductoisomerase [Thermotogota bacterium]|nr:1-deoxy-D-xylulose-5-phosphate reductoisomerase [Thermotogota bacterium]MDK2864557.1 1-deoxy-D-xylulose-5-phosphate reductoisomerase [Thermotogota bacterium]HCZ06318.1 1-deoxy-D-xylulose-5-phosphate reductoisomerase [Thermotogota bacterium]
MKLLVLGATGSIGKQALEVAEKLGIEIVGISVHKRVDEAFKIVRRFNLKYMAVTGDIEDVSNLGDIPADLSLFTGRDALYSLAEATHPDAVLVGVPGIAGLYAVLQVYRFTERVCMANKESVVTGGGYLKGLLEESGVRVVPVDSEHSAVLQLLERSSEPAKVILTASGGALRDLPLAEIEEATVSQVLMHPNWSMGNKVTVDSATMVNKGLELFEAMWFFDLFPHQVDAVICRDSFVHAAVIFKDGVIKMHAGFPDMRVPIAYSLTEPDRRWQGEMPDLMGRTISFEPVDPRRYPAFDLAKAILDEKDSLRVAYCVSDEIAVELFLKGKIRFGDIHRVIERVVSRMEPVNLGSLDEIERAIEEAEKISWKVVRSWK